MRSEGGVAPLLERRGRRSGDADVLVLGHTSIWLPPTGKTEQPVVATACGSLTDDKLTVCYMVVKCASGMSGLIIVGRTNADAGVVPERAREGLASVDIDRSLCTYELSKEDVRRLEEGGHNSIAYKYFNKAREQPRRKKQTCQSTSGTGSRSVRRKTDPLMRLVRRDRREKSVGTNRGGRIHRLKRAGGARWCPPELRNTDDETRGPMRGRPFTAGRLCDRGCVHPTAQ